jgi:hypothetical protein
LVHSGHPVRIRGEDYDKEGQGRCAACQVNTPTPRQNRYYQRTFCGKKLEIIFAAYRRTSKYLIVNIDTLEAIVAEAILSAPAQLCGVAETHRKLLNDKALCRDFRAKSLQLQSWNRQSKLLSIRSSSAGDKVRLETGALPPHEFVPN